MAWMLVMDTCGEGGGIGLARVDGARVEMAAERSLPGRETQERLMVALHEVLVETGVAVRDLAAIAVVHGPGSFTGVRIGLAAAKGLAEAAGLPLLAISRLAVLASTVDGDAPVQAWMDAGRGDVFAGRYRGGVCESEAMLPGAAAVASAGGDRVVVMEERVASLLPGAVRVPAVGVREAMPLAAARLRAGEFAAAAQVEANYLRVPDAELALRAKLCL